MKKYFTFISLIIFSLLLIGCNTHEHYYEKQYIDSTCTESGTIVYTCECSDTYSEKTTEPLGHEYGDWEIINPSTMTLEGTKEQKCIRCNNTNTELIEKKQYPNLGGYTIKIAQTETALHILDPFLKLYTQKDKEAKQRAWKEVEELFNCKIEVIPYPENVYWGESRVRYILESKNNPQYDFYYDETENINIYARNGAILKLDDFYVLHGNNLMNNAVIKSGKFENALYSFCEGMPYLYNIIAYNLNILKDLQTIDPSLEEPAKIFNDGNWTLDVFIEYCYKVQTLMEQVYGSKGQPNSKDQDYFAIGGPNEYWWMGLATCDGKLIIDSNTSKVNLDSLYKREAGDILKSLYKDGLVDNNFRSIAWGQYENSFFMSTKPYEIKYGNQHIWDEMNIGYVPWPRANDMKFDDITLPVDEIKDQFVMARGRDYSQYGKECTAENIYWALVEVYNRTKQYYEEEDIERVPGAYFFKSEESKKAIEYIYNLIQEDKAYYEPFLTLQATELSLGTDLITIKGVVNQYCVTNKISTWDEAIKEYTLVVKKYLQDNFQ